MEVGETISEPWTKMQQSCSRFITHASVAIGSPSDNALKQTKHRPNAMLFIKGRDELHL